MDRGFRLVLRGGFFLLLLVGMGLIVYASLVSDGRKPARGAPADAVAPAPLPPPADAAPSSPEPPPAVTEEPAAEEPTPAPEQPKERPPARGQAELRGFSTATYDENGREEATLTGERGVPRKEFYEVFLPNLLWHGRSGEGGGVGAQLGDVKITALRAELDMSRGNWRLFDDVNVRGKNFTITTQSVAYNASKRALESDQPVRIHRETSGEGDGTPGMTIEGTGLDVDLTVSKMTIRSDVRARLSGLSKDFMTTQQDAGGEAGDGTTDVIITSTGRMDYMHLARQVVFHDSVRALWGTKTLTCDTLTVQLGETEGAGTLRMQQVRADGNVQLVYEKQAAPGVDGRQVARGDALDWDSVTETAELTGAPAELSTAEFDLKGPVLTLYHMDERFHVAGAGTLFWKGSAAPAPPRPAGRLSAADVTPFSLESGSPVTVTWQDSMKYEPAEHRAVFTGGVRASQGARTLESDQLVLTFSPENGGVETVTADGNVRAHGAGEAADSDVLCEQLVWYAATNAVELTAPEGGTVTVASGPNTITARQVTLNDPPGTLKCTTPGKLTVPGGEAPAGREGGAVRPPTVVQWQKGMRFVEDETPVATFWGDVVAAREGRRITGDSLRLEFTPEMKGLRRVVVTGGAAVEVRSGPHEGQKAEAEGPGPAPREPQTEVLPGVPALKGDDWRLEADEITMLPETEVISAKLPGTLTIFSGGAPGGTISWQKGMRAALQEGRATFTGQAKADLSGSTLESDSLTVEFDRTTRRLRHILADGNARVVTRQDGGWHLQSEMAEAVFSADNELQHVIARKNVKVQDPLYLLTSDVLTLFMTRDEESKTVVIDRAVAEREVRVEYKEEDLRAGGNRLEWQRETDTFVLTGEDPQAYWRYGSLMERAPVMVMDRASGQMHLPRGKRPHRTQISTERF